MSLNLNEFQSIQKVLENNFLYNNDADSLHVLMSLLENEYRMKKLKPKYTCMRSIARSIRREMRHRSDAKDVVQTITRLLNDDINRLEFAVYVKGYSMGYQDKAWADKLETVTLSYLPVEDLYNRTTLFHTRVNSDILVLKTHLLDELEDSVPYFRQLGIFATKYCEKKFRNKIMRLNIYHNKQLILWQDPNAQRAGFSEPSILVKDDLERIYQRIVRAFSKSIAKLYKEAYWYGVNDRVISRY